MKIEQRSYGGKIFRPSPIIHIENDGQLFIIATPWGSPDAAKKSIQTIIDYYLSTQQDHEITSPFEFITSLSLQENNLRTALLLANENIYREENKDGYNTACEIFIGTILNGTLYSAQLGQPHLILYRQEQLYPLTLNFDFTIDYGLFLPPIPKNLLGLQSSINPSLNTTKLYHSDNLLLVSRSKYLNLFQSNTLSDPMTHLCNSFSTEDPDAAFWIAKISF